MNREPKQAILAGHSTGNVVAIWLALSRITDVLGFLAIGPGGLFMDEPGKWLPLMVENYDCGQRGYIIVGEDDSPVSHARILALVEMLNDHGIPCELEIIPGAGHNFTPNYGDGLLRGLNFIAYD